MLKVSVITVNYNNAKGLELSLQSIQEQIFRSIEVIVIDGGSSDCSRQIIDKFKETICYAVSEPDGGIYNAMNKGISKATGDYLLFLNSGDCFADSQSLSSLCMEAFEDIVYGHVFLKKKGGHLIPFKYPRVLNILDLYVKPLCHQAILIRRSLFSKIGPYCERSKYSSDWQHYMLAIFKHGATYKLVEKFVVIYDHTGVSSSGEFEEEIWREKRAFMDRHFPVLANGDAIGKYHRTRDLLVSLKKNPIINAFITLGFFKSIKGFDN